MKRSPLRRKTPLRGQQTPLERKTVLKPSSASLERQAILRRAGRRAESFEARTARVAWHTVPWDTPCRWCGESVKGAPPHHAVPKQALKRVAKARGFPAWFLLWDPRVRVIVCRDCHARHENGQRMPRRCLSNANLAFASDIDCEVYVGSRFYRL